MPSSIVEVSEFSADIQVPNGNELTRAAALRAFVQKLTNRTRWIADQAAMLVADQAWLGINTFQNRINLNDTLVVRPDSATAPAVQVQSPVTPSNWEYKLGIQAGTDKYARVYGGGNGSTLGALAVVYNAVWNGTEWQQVDEEKRSIALIWRFQDLRLVGKPDHSAPWATWPQSGIATFGGSFLTELVRGARVQAEANTDGTNTNGFQYADAVTRWSPIPLGSYWGNVELNADGHVCRAAVSSNDKDQIWIPIRVPPLCSFRTVKIHMHQFVDDGIWDEFQLYKRSGSGPWVAQGAVDRHHASGEVTTTFHGSTWQLVTDGDEWAYRWKVLTGALASVDSRIVGAEVEWSDVGPNNRVG